MPYNNNLQEQIGLLVPKSIETRVAGTFTDKMQTYTIFPTEFDEKL